jgi:aldose 1-epimerase
MSNLEQTMQQGVAYDGYPAKIVTLNNQQGMSVAFMDIGATWLSCCVPVNNELREVLLGVNTLENFNQHAGFMGVTVGRYANRIAKGQFELCGQSIQADVNAAGNCLHGGKTGFDKRRWDVAKLTETSVEFSLISADGDQGFPGELTVFVKYTLTDTNQVVISYRATTTTETVVNLTNHAYFNLLGAETQQSALDHILSINADSYLRNDETGIPTGEFIKVKGTSFDFTSPKVISSDFLSDDDQERASGYDHNFVLNSECKKGECAATLTSPDSLVRMKVFTDKPGVQLYTGNFLQGNPNRTGTTYVNNQGVALETQFFPDSPNHPEWQQSNASLKAGEVYQYETIYQFLVGKK